MLMPKLAAFLGLGYDIRARLDYEDFLINISLGFSLKMQGL